MYCGVPLTCVMQMFGVSHGTWLRTAVNAESRDISTWSATTIRSDEPALEELRLHANPGEPTVSNP